MSILCRKKKYYILCRNLISSILFFFMVFVFCGCAPSMPTNESVRHVVDALGNDCLLPVKPERIVCMDIGGSEITMLLADPARIIAVSRYMDDPGGVNLSAEAKEIPFRTENNAEQVLEMRPDLVVIATPGKDQLVGQLKQLKQPVFLLKQAISPKDVIDNMRVLAVALGEEKKAEKLITAMENDLQTLQEETELIPLAKRKKAVRIANSGAMGGTATMFEGITRAAGCINVAALVDLERGILSKEQLLITNPDIFVLPVWDHNSGKPASNLQFEYENDPSLQEIKGIQEKSFVYIPDYFIISQSPYLLFAVTELAKAAYEIEIDSELEKLLPEGTVRYGDLKNPRFVMSPLEKRPAAE